MRYDNQANSINLVAEYIRKTDSTDDITISLDLFRKKVIDEDDIEKFLKQAKHSGYKEYERSFVGSHFKTNENKLFLRYKGEDESRSVYQMVKAIINDELTVKESIGYLYELIVGKYTPQDMVKGDLECINPVYNKNGKKIIDYGEIVEVKKLDHGGDSYLSEFFAIYKNSNIPKDALKPNFIKIYNNLIDGLYELFKTFGDNILEDIKNNFAGIIYSQNTFITSDDIELYWSNKGRSSCSKDHRLTIRYRVNKSNVNGYIYENDEDVLLDKKIKIKLDRDKIICPILKPKTISESFKLEDVSDLLLEGRKEDVIKRYSELTIEPIISYFSDEDPSGNNKYLEWMVKAWLDLNNNESPVPVVSALSDLVLNVVKLFHKNIQRIKNKDINSYTYKELRETVYEAEEKRKLAEIKKEAKKQKTVIYEDDKWFVVSPHSWRASCYYGAGTKWCVTMKNNSEYWDTYSRRSVFFYVIDKTKNKTDPQYKIAYRKIGLKDKYELWDAEDKEITYRKAGNEWFDSLPEVMKEKIDTYHKEKMPLGEKPEWVNDDPQAQVILRHLGDVGIESVGYEYYGLPVYDTDDGYYVAGTEEEMEDALRDYFEGYHDDELMEYYDYSGDYLQMIDEDGFIDSEVKDRFDYSSDGEILEWAGEDGRYEDIETEIEELRDELIEINVETEEEKVDDIEFQIEKLINEQSELIDKAKIDVEDSERESWEDCLSDGVVNCLTRDKGWFRNVGELLGSGIVELDRTGLIDDLVNSTYDYSILSSYPIDEETDDDDNYWYVFEIDY